MGCGLSTFNKVLFDLIFSVTQNGPMDNCGRDRGGIPRWRVCVCVRVSRSCKRPSTVMRCDGSCPTVASCVTTAATTPRSPLSSSRCSSVCRRLYEDLSYNPQFSRKQEINLWVRDNYGTVTLCNIEPSRIIIVVQLTLCVVAVGPL